MPRSSVPLVIRNSRECTPTSPSASASCAVLISPRPSGSNTPTRNMQPSCGRSSPASSSRRACCCAHISSSRSWRCVKSRSTACTWRTWRRRAASVYSRRVIDPARIMARCDALAQFSEFAGGLTRIYLSSEQRLANDLVSGWMREAGMSARIDAVGNVVGRYEGERSGLPCLMLGSHLDTVRDAGKYDGMLGVVTAINGFVRMAVTLRGTAGHAGTVPMGLRRDALAAAAECVLAVERVGRSELNLVATVGRIEALPGAINVIPGEVRFTVDARAPVNDQRERAYEALTAEIGAVAKRRSLEHRIERLHDHPVTACAPWLMQQLDRAVGAEGIALRRLPSGAGHDGIAICAIADIAMLFVRCKRGVSHHPAEAIDRADAAIATRVLLRFIENFTVPGRA